MNQDLKLTVLQNSVDKVLGMIHDLSTRMGNLEINVKKSQKKFEACAVGFYQIRDACTLLREELSEATGTLIDATYNDS